jgi:hypothetical protein
MISKREDSPIKIIQDLLKETKNESKCAAEMKNS